MRYRRQCVNTMNETVDDEDCVALYGNDGENKDGSNFTFVKVCETGKPCYCKNYQI